MNEKHPAIFLQAVERRYHQGEATLEILNHADFAVWPGQSVALIGPSGAGKSTLLHIAGLLEHPDAGEVFIEGLATSGLSDADRTRIRRNEIGFVYQFHHLLGEFSALENVMLPQMIRGLSRGETRRRATELLSYLGLKDRLNHRPAELSGGEQQRVAIARAFIAGPKLLLADEPTGNLDGNTGHLVIDCLFEQHARHGTTLLLVTHDPAIAERCERQVRLMDGNIVEDRRITRGRVAAIGRAR